MVYDGVEGGVDTPPITGKNRRAVVRDGVGRLFKINSSPRRRKENQAEEEEPRDRGFLIRVGCVSSSHVFSVMNVGGLVRGGSGASIW